MNVTILDEPELEFAHGSHHIDPRHGISYYGPADAGASGPATIRVGVIGTRVAIQGVKSWLDRCREPIAAKQSRLTHLYLPFPGFDTNVGFRSTIVWNSRLERILDKRSVEGLKTMSPLTAVHAAVELYDAELATLNEEPNCDVVIVCRPDELPGSALTLWQLWQRVPATEELDGDDEAFTDEMWAHYVHQIARESEHTGGVPDLALPLGSIDNDDGTAGAGP